MNMSKICLFSCLVSIISSVGGQVFRSVSAMERLVETQGNMLELFETYLQTQEENLKLVKKRIAAIKSEYETAVQNPEKYVSNPVNSFRIIKQLHVDWNDTIILMNEAVREFIYKIEEMKNIHSFPSEADMQEATNAILRLQHMYLIETKDLAEGVLNGVNCGIPFNSHDCFVLGMEMVRQQSPHAAQEWFELGVSKYNPEEYVVENKSVIMEHKIYNEFRRGDVKSALKSMKDLYFMNPDFVRLSEHIETFENIMKNETLLQLSITHVDQHIFNDSNYYKLCRSELDRPPSIMKNLKCRYLTSRYAFTKIAPFKVEEQYLQPYVVLFHDIITDDEIDYLKEQSRVHLKVATVQVSNEIYVSKERISMNTHFDNYYSSIITRLNTRMEHMTGLDLRHAEHPQIANYAMGGHFTEHFDHSTMDDIHGFHSESVGNRLASILIYMSDVAQGGNTVFSMLGISVKPKKGTALMWYNLHLSGEANTDTLHAACPVLEGSKWVLNKWIRYLGNDIARPCNLEYQKEGPCSDHPEPIAIRYS